MARPPASRGQSLIRTSSSAPNVARTTTSVAPAWPVVSGESAVAGALSSTYRKATGPGGILSISNVPSYSTFTRAVVSRSRYSTSPSVTGLPCGSSTRPSRRSAGSSTTIVSAQTQPGCS